MCKIIYHNKSQLRSQVCVCVLHLLQYCFDLPQVSGDILQFISVKQHVRTHKQLFKTFACLLNVIAARFYPSVPSIFLISFFKSTNTLSPVLIMCVIFTSAAVKC